MKWFTLLGIFSVVLVAVYAAPSDVDLSHQLIVSGSGKESRALSDEPIRPRDWLTDIIKAILGIDVPVLLTQIDTCLKGLERLVTTAVTQLTEIIGAVNDDIKREINALIETALARALCSVEPLLSKLGLVLPIISSNRPPVAGEQGIHDFVSDVIESLLGITLEDLLTMVATALIDMDQILAETLNRLKAIALHAPAIADRIDRITDDCVVESQELITPILAKLYQVLPIKMIPKDAVRLPCSMKTIRFDASSY